MAFTLGDKPGDPVKKALDTQYSLMDMRNPTTAALYNKNVLTDKEKKIKEEVTPVVGSNEWKIKQSVEADKVKQKERQKELDAKTDEEWEAEAFAREKASIDRSVYGSGAITTGAANIAATEGGQDILNWVPGSGEVIDAKNTLKDLKAGDYTGAGMSAAGLMLPFIPGGAVKRFFGRTDTPPVKSSVRPKSTPSSVVNTSTVDQYNTPRNFREGVDADSFGGVRGGDHNYGDELRTSVGGKANKLDEFTQTNPDWNTNPENFKYLGSKGGRDMIEFNSPAGNQTFYRSSGLGGKAGSAGSWVPFEGYQNMSKWGGNKEWFMKEGSQGAFHGNPMKTIHLDKNHPRYKQGDRSISVRQQLEELDVDPMEAIRSGDFKLNKPGYDFNYTSNPDSKIHNVASGLEKIENQIVYGPLQPR